MAYKKYLAIGGIFVSVLLVAALHYDSDINTVNTPNYFANSAFAVSQSCSPSITPGLLMEIPDLSTGDREIKSYSFKHVVPQSTGTGSARQTGNIEFGNFVITKNLDSISPNLITALSRQTQLPELTIQVCFGDPADPTKYEIKLERVRLCSYEQMADISAFPPMETIEFCWEKMFTDFTPSIADQQAGEESTSSETDPGRGGF